MRIKGFECLYITDIGSRARGLNTPTSDHDLFCIFRQPVEDYISLKGYESDFNIKDIHTIEKDLPYIPQIVCGGSLQGMNIRKFCELLRKSNPTAIEMCISPITHYDEIGKERLIELAESNFNPIALMMHYHSLAKENYHKYIKNREETSVKRYLSILRGIDNRDFIIKNQTIPPIEYIKVVNDLYDASQSYEDELRQTLIQFKKNGINFNLDYSRLNFYIESKLQISAISDDLNNLKRNCAELDKLLFEFIIPKHI